MATRRESFGHHADRFRSFARLAESGEAPRLDDTAGSRAVEAWFLGPRAENAELLERLIVEAIRDQVFWRRNFHPGDPSQITEEIKRSDQYLEAMGKLEDGLREMLAFLKKSVPFFSMRYQGHMNWDLTLPGIVGYFAAMLYNPNNVAFEGSTATTLLELLVGDDICRMLGYEIPSDDRAQAGEVRPWGHITCDGTVANIEAIWSARNLKFYALALASALNTEADLAQAKALTVTLPSGQTRLLVELTPWQLLNLGVDEVLSLPGQMQTRYGIGPEVITSAVTKHSLQTLGLVEFSRRFLPGIPPPVFFVPGAKHYSFPKAAALLGLGAAQMIDVAVDLDARLDLGDLRRRLEECLAARRPVLSVVAVIGSTEESAVDPVARVLELRDEFLARGLAFTVHADAAWGGYHRTVINPDFRMAEPAAFAEPPPAAPLSSYVVRQLEALSGTDSITVDPHKSGYIPYPAGALCYRNSAMRNLVTFSAPVIYRGGAEPTVGIYGVEGSKPGAAAASVYLSHKIIRPSKSGYGKIIGQALFSCRKLYARLLTMSRPEDPFVVVPLPRLPSERRGGSETERAAEREQIRDLIDRRSGEQIRSDARAMALLQEIGPDLNILAYALNFRRSDGTLNSDLAWANRLNRALYDRLSIDPGEDIYGYDLLVSSTDLDVRTYGTPLIDDYKSRLGVGSSEGSVITVLRSVVMDPWVTETTAGSFIDTLEHVLRKEVLAAMESVRPMHHFGY
jgi:glutamate/tyrosine decarboxylase-like PLP-dependent enzyme